jgi:hypothetical protein
VSHLGTSRNGGHLYKKCVFGGRMNGNNVTIKDESFYSAKYYTMRRVCVFSVPETHLTNNRDDKMDKVNRPTEKNRDRKTENKKQRNNESN